MPDSNLDSLHYEDFAPHVNSAFQVLLGEPGSIEILLASVEDKSPSPKQEQFVLTFRAPLTAPNQQGLFHLQHAALGAGVLFLVPISRSADGLIYEAVFNRPREAK